MDGSDLGGCTPVFRRGVEDGNWRSQAAEQNPPKSYALYIIYNNRLAKAYVGITSQKKPEIRAKGSLVDKETISADYQGHQEDFEVVILKERFENVLIGCIAEFALMQEVRDAGWTLYNKNRFGGHVHLRDEARLAFNAVVSILSPDDGLRPEVSEIDALVDFMPAIEAYLAREDVQASPLKNLFWSRLKDEIIKMQSKMLKSQHEARLSPPEKPYHAQNATVIPLATALAPQKDGDDDGPNFPRAA